MKIGIAFDLAPSGPMPEGPDDRFEEFDRPETVEAIADVIRGEGHDVVLLGDGREFLARVMAEPPDFVWNLAEGEGVGPSRESRVPAVLEMLAIPFSGSGPATLGATLDKEFAKRIVANVVHVPFGYTVVPGAEATLLPLCLEQMERQVGYPLILKPSCEGSSKGIRAGSLVRDHARALEVYRGLVADYDQPVMVEEFVEGDEVTVGLVGQAEGALDVIGTMKVIPKSPDRDFVYSLEVKRDWRNRVRYETPARFAPEVQALIEQSARDAFRALRCRDVARVDFRVRDGIPYFLEANPLPGLAPGVSDLVILAEGHGIGYAELIRKILHASLARVGLS